jgi:ribosomal-protein-alanine N-acetyltransferase
MQRTGIGARLLTWLEKSCRTAGMRQIRVDVRANNDKARTFYERSGFSIVGQVAGYYDRREPAIVMIKVLTDASTE